MEAAFLAVLKEAGPFVAIFGFFVWRDFKREQSLGAVIAELQDFQRNTLMRLIEQTTQVIMAATSMMERCHDERPSD